MTLQVPFDQFAKAVERTLGVKLAFVRPHAGGALVTAADPAKGVVLAALSGKSCDEARKALTDAGMEIYEGGWSIEGSLEMEASPLSEAYVAAVAYESSDKKPGLWVDAFTTLPTEIQVLKGLYEEFRTSGQLDEVSFEEFVRMANPTIVIASPKELLSFLEQKRDEDC
jgi:hypothetical protein